MTTAQAITAGLFAVSTVVAGVVGVTLSGFFPTVSRPDTLGGITGGALVGLLSASALALGLTALWTAIDVLSWTVIVICGGMGILIAPMVFEGLPRGFCDSRPGVLTLTGIASLLLVLVLGVTTY